MGFLFAVLALVLCELETDVNTDSGTVAVGRIRVIVAVGRRRVAVVVVGAGRGAVGMVMRRGRIAIVLVVRRVG